VRVAGNDLSLFERLAADWWNERSPGFRSLHGVKDHHLALLRAHCGARLAGARVCDLGCGGGLLSEPLAALGASVIGVDVSPASLRVAAARPQTGRRLYVRGDARLPPLAPAAFDLALLVGLVEHVPEPAALVQAAAAVLRPGGQLFAVTLNRTRRARVLAVAIAERIGLIPCGTHDPALFVTPAELHAAAAGAGLAHVRTVGSRVRLWPTLRRRAIALAPSTDVSVCYASFFEKRGAA
jgi:2-polyprenyl-6-hydroxyphenyl methylase/3-demethylubiquinone-9 3-methyltransferase